MKFNEIAHGRKRLRILCLILHRHEAILAKNEKVQLKRAGIRLDNRLP